MIDAMKAASCRATRPRPPDRGRDLTVVASTRSTETGGVAAGHRGRRAHLGGRSRAEAEQVEHSRALGGRTGRTAVQRALARPGVSGHRRRWSRHDPLAQAAAPVGEWSTPPETFANYRAPTGVSPRSDRPPAAVAVYAERAQAPRSRARRTPPASWSQAAGSTPLNGASSSRSRPRGRRPRVI